METQDNLANTQENSKLTQRSGRSLSLHLLNKDCESTNLICSQKWRKTHKKGKLMLLFQQTQKWNGDRKEAEKGRGSDGTKGQRGNKGGEK